MDWLMLAVGSTLAYCVYLYETGAAAVTDDAAAPVDSPKEAIRRGIVERLGLPDAAVEILYAQAKLETGNFGAWYLPQTKSMFNRHIGSGRGEWKGSGLPKSALVEGEHYVYVSPGDPDIRCFTDYGQCARDMAQLLQDPLYRAALAGLRRGSAPDYFNALRAAGFSTQDSYATALMRVYESA